MAVLIEALSIVIRMADIRNRFPGGWSAFQEVTSTGSLCSDSEIVRVSFTRTDDVRDFIQYMLDLGFVYIREDGGAADIAVIGQDEGFIPRCDWLDSGVTKLDGNDVVMAKLKGSMDKTLVTPPGWAYRGSISQKGQSVDRDKR